MLGDLTSSLLIFPSDDDILLPFLRGLRFICRFSTLFFRQRPFGAEAVKGKLDTAILCLSCRLRRPHGWEPSRFDRGPYLSLSNCPSCHPRPNLSPLGVHSTWPFNLCCNITRPRSRSYIVCCITFFSVADIVFVALSFIKNN